MIYGNANPIDIALTITARSINKLRKKTGIVIRVGSAARFMIREIAIAPMVNAQSSGKFPDDKTNTSVSGVMRHAWPAIIIASQNMRLSSCPLHQSKNLTSIDLFDSCAKSAGTYTCCRVSIIKFFIIANIS
jgi:hypothetical protein